MRFAVARAAVGAALLLGVSAISSTFVAPANGGVVSACSVTWDGSAGDHRWETAANWTPEVIPGGGNGQPAEDYVCIPNGSGLVRVVTGVERSVHAIEVRQGVELRLEEGSKLFIRGDQATYESIVFPSGKLTVNGATFGGEGRLTLAGSMRWHSKEGAAATLTTRECAVYYPDYISGQPYVDTEPCQDGDGHLDGDRGLIEVLETGSILVDGRGVNLYDGYRLDITGKLILDGDGYIAADRGTVTRLMPAIGLDASGQLIIKNDGGYYEGFTRFGETELSRFVNSGLIHKKAGDRNSLITADYTQPTGRVRVDSGRLLLPDGAVRAADVKGGRTYGTGTCPVGVASVDCQARVTSADSQNADFTVSKADRDRASVRMQELDPGTGTRDIGRVVLAHAGGLDATKAKPALLTFRYDASLLGGRKWHEVDVWRKHGSTPYRLVKRCVAGAIPAGETACLAPGPSHTTGSGDVVLVVKATATSRWIIRRSVRR